MYTQPVKLAGQNILERGFSTASKRGDGTLLFFQPSHTHQFSINNCLPLRIHPPWHLTHTQSPKTCWGSLWLPPSVTPSSQNVPFLPLLAPVITPPTLVHTLCACSMLPLPLSYAHVLNHIRIYIETIILCLPLETLVPSFHIFLLPIYQQRQNLTQSDSHFF